MAKQVENIVVRLGLERFEGLDKIKSSFRDLGKVTKLTESDILDARTAIFDFAKDAGNTEAVVDGLKSALTGLRSQADLCGTAYSQLTQDLRQLSEVQQGATAAIMRNRDELVRNFSETTRNIRALREHRDALIAIQAETRQYSRTYDVLSNDIALVRERITEVTAVAKGLNVALSRAFPSTAAGVRATLANINEGIQLQRDIINEIDLRTSKERKLASSLAERAQAERLLNNALVAQRQLSFGERVRAGRESVRVSAEAFNAPTMTGGYYSAENIGRRMGDLPNTVAGLNQELSELSERLANTTRGSSTYVDVAIRMAQIQKELKNDVMGTAEAFRRLSLAEEGVERRAGKVSAVQDYYATQGPTAPGVGGFRDPRTGAIIARGAYDPNRIRVQEQAYPQPIGPVEYSGIAKDAIADRKKEIRQRIDNLRAITQENAALREQNAIRRSIARGRARTNRDAPIPTQMRDISSLYQQIGQIGMQPIISDIERMGNSYDTVANDIRRATAASNNSVQSLQTQRSAWQALLSQLDPASTAFRATSREIEKLDARLAKVQRSRRLSGMQLAQGAGAVVSGGIFGGPEGFLGGAAGLALGGVGGAFAGAAFGAQVGMLRKALGTTAEYAAQIQKSKIALEGAAGNQQEFNRALQAADSVTRSLNVPQEIAVQGMTKLTAAVKGAGGQVSDAELVFKNVTAAIKATGGSAQDVDGAITAMVQVFSKGKVSAEELSGQLGERLPGAVTKFAEANNMTLPELQKGLEQGQIGLNELMNFIVKLGGDYAGVAEKIAASSQDAGARLTVAFNNMRLAVGQAIQPIGAEFQEAFIPLIETITPALVSVVPVIGDIALSVAKNIDILAASAIAAGLALGALQVASIKVAGTAGLSALGVALTKVAAAAGTAVGALGKITAIAALVNPWVALAAGIGAATYALIKHNQAQQEYIDLIDSGMGSTDELRATQRRLEDQIHAAKKALEGSAEGMGATGRRAMQLKMEVAQLENQLARINKTFTIRLKLEREGYTFDEKGIASTFTVAGNVYDVKTRRRLRTVDGSPLNGITEFKPPRTETSPAGTRGASDRAAEKAARAEQQVQERLRALKREIELNEQLSVVKNLQFEAEMAGDDELQIRLRGEERIVQITQGLARTLDGVTDDRLRTLEVTKAENQIAEARQQTAFEMARFEAARKQHVEDVLNKLRDEQELLIARRNGNEAEVILRQQIRDMTKGMNDADRERVELLMRQNEELRKQQELSIGGGIREGINQYIESVGTAGEATAKLTQTGIKGLEDALFSLVTTGTANFQEFAASLLRDTARMILQLTIQRILMQIIGAINPGASVAALQSNALGGLTAALGSGFADGGVFAANGVQAFARGGVVNKPTLFPFADGGTMRTGLMGEAGPEAIMPLRRGPSGRLGVEAVGGGGGVNVVVNVDAKGTRVEGDQQEGASLGRAVSAAVQAELIKQQRPGGILNR